MPQVWRDFLATEFPDNGAQLGERMKGEPVVHAPDVPVAIQQAVAAFAVGVVDDHIESGHGAKGRCPSGHQRKIVRAQVSDDELLERARTQRAILTIDREGNDVPPEGRADQESRDLTLAESPLGEIVQRRLAFGRLVYTEGFGTIRAAHLGKVGVIRAIRHQSTRFDPPGAQQALPRLALKKPSRLRHPSMMPVQSWADAAIVVDGTAAHRAGRTPRADHPGGVRGEGLHLGQAGLEVPGGRLIAFFDHLHQGRGLTQQFLGEQFFDGQGCSLNEGLSFAAAGPSPRPWSP